MDVQLLEQKDRFQDEGGFRHPAGMMVSSWSLLGIRRALLSVDAPSRDEFSEFQEFFLLTARKVVPVFKSSVDETLFIFCR